MAERDSKTVIIKRVKKAGAAHHGGAWKVAYADFVTAMMALFLLLWLLNSVTEEQLQGISDYFSPETVSMSPSGAGGMLGGQVIGEGASQNNMGSPIEIMLPPPTIGRGGEDFTDPKEGASEEDFDGFTDEEFESERERREQERFDEVAEELRQAMQTVPDLLPLQQNLIIDNTPEGLRIQIVDQEGQPMFPAGSSAMYERTQKLLGLVSRVIAGLPQKVAITGHTDSSKFAEPTGYGNWELSSDRALATRRVLEREGLGLGRVDRVVGEADTDPLLPEAPDSPQNRRVSITLLREAPPQDVGKDELRRMPSIINP